MTTNWLCPRCKHDHTDPPWREGDEDICNMTMGAFICGCRYKQAEAHKPGAVINRIGPHFGKQQCNYCVEPWPCSFVLDN